MTSVSNGRDTRLYMWAAASTGPVQALQPGPHTARPTHPLRGRHELGGEALVACQRRRQHAAGLGAQRGGGNRHHRHTPHVGRHAPPPAAPAAAPPLPRARRVGTCRCVGRFGTLLLLLLLLRRRRGGGSGGRGVVQGQACPAGCGCRHGCGHGCGCGSGCGGVMEGTRGGGRAPGWACGGGGAPELGAGLGGDAGLRRHQPLRRTGSHAPDPHTVPAVRVPTYPSFLASHALALPTGTSMRGRHHTVMQLPAGVPPCAWAARGVRTRVGVVAPAAPPPPPLPPPWTTTPSSASAAGRPSAAAAAATAAAARVSRAHGAQGPDSSHTMSRQHSRAARRTAGRLGRARSTEHRSSRGHRQCRCTRAQAAGPSAHGANLCRWQQLIAACRAVATALTSRPAFALLRLAHPTPPQKPSIPATLLPLPRPPPPSRPTCRA